MRRNRHRRLTVAACALALTLSGCERRFSVPAPVVGGPTADLPPNDPAAIDVPAAIAFSRIRAQLDSVFPPADSLDRAACTSLGGLICHQYVYRRDSLAIRMVGDRIELRTTLRYRARVALPGLGAIAACGYAPEGMRHASLRLSTSLYWRSDWRVASRNTDLAVSLTDPCQVTMLHVDATPLARRIVRAQAAMLAAEIDSILPATADLRPLADSLWRMLQRPIALDSTSTVWLAMSPETVALSPLSGGGSAIMTALVLTARPRITMGASPSLDPRPLPMLTLAAPGSEIHVPLEIELPFDELGQKATALLSGEVAGKGIRVGEIGVWGAGDTAVVRVAVAGRVNGSLYLTGVVAYDSTMRAVTITNLRYTLASADVMSRIKATLGAGRIGSAIDEATGHGRLAVGPQLDSLRALLTTQLNRPLGPGVTLTGGVTAVRVAGLFTTSTSFVLRVVLDATAVIVVA